MVLEQSGSSDSVSEFGKTAELSGIAICYARGGKVVRKDMLDLDAPARLNVFGINGDPDSVRGGSLEKEFNSAIKVNVQLEFVERWIRVLPEGVLEDVVPRVLSQLAKVFMGGDGLEEEFCEFTELFLRRKSSEADMKELSYIFIGAGGLREG